MPPISAGCVFFTRGAGLIGWIIQAFTRSPWAHVGVAHSAPDADGWFDTVEAFPGGVRRMRRHVDEVAAGRWRIVQLARTPAEQQQIVAASDTHVGLRYAYGELVRIVFYGLAATARTPVAAVASLATLAAGVWTFTVALLVAVVGFAVVDRIPSSARSAFCGQHAAAAVLAARPELQLRFSPERTWPGQLTIDVGWQQQLDRAEKPGCVRRAGAHSQ